ncbi:MAG TPA: cysteine dioxygenase family protein [Candidatus Baltobacteraceae bacterium]|nr:cysteine dioxygenase family protein [Candidatus Baltobacteraceae bacterium]
MIARELIARLADSLGRVRSGDGTTAEVVQWLRASSEAAAAVPAPEARCEYRDYTRTLLFKNDLFEILALHWRPNSISAIHDHGGALCWLSVARGTLGVENYLRTDTGAANGYACVALEGRDDLRAGSIDYRQDDVHLHRCVARDSEAVTLHVYAHPIERFHTFDERSNTCTEVHSTYDAVLAS